MSGQGKRTLAVNGRGQAARSGVLLWVSHHSGARVVKEWIKMVGDGLVDEWSNDFHYWTCSLDNSFGVGNVVNEKGVGLVCAVVQPARELVAAGLNHDLGSNSIALRVLDGQRHQRGAAQREQADPPQTQPLASCQRPPRDLHGDCWSEAGLCHKKDRARLRICV